MSESSSPTSSTSHLPKLDIIKPYQLNPNLEKDEYDWEYRPRPEDLKPVDMDPDWESEHPIFMNQINDPNNINIMALQEMKYGLSTPIELADSFKHEANVILQTKNTRLYQHAITLYSKALAEKINDPIRTSIYFSNRAAVNLELGNYKYVLDDCQSAIKFNANNFKAYFRACQAATQLKKYDQAVTYANEAMAREMGEKEKKPFEEEFKKIEKLVQIQRGLVEKESRYKRSIEREKQTSQSKHHKWLQCLAQEDIAIGSYLFERMGTFLTDKIKAYIDDEKHTHWPVLFLYEEFEQLDLIQDFKDEDSFDKHLQIMFPKEEKGEAGEKVTGYAQWDTKREYVYEKIELYTMFNHVPAFLKKDKSMLKPPRKVKINRHTTLRKVLTHPEYVVPGYPVFYIVVQDSTFKKDFLKKNIH